MIDGRHLESLQSRGLSTETISKTNYYSVTAEEANKILNRNDIVSGGICIPYPQFQNHCRIRLDEPHVTYERVNYGKNEGKTKANCAKYLSPIGSKNHIFKATRREFEYKDVSLPLFITEGEMKSDVLAQEGFCAIGLAGVYGWKDSSEKEDRLLKDFDKISFQDRLVYIVFDSDIESNPNVHDAETRLALTLTKEGADVKTIRLMTVDDSKVGVDDYIAKYGVDSFKRCIEEAEDWDEHLANSLKIKSATDLLHETIEDLEKTRNEGQRGPLTGFSKLDEQLNGLYGMCVLVGAPKTYKTTIAMQWALHMLKNEHVVLYYDVENGRHLTNRRILSQLSGIPDRDLCFKQFSSEQLKRFEDAKEEFYSLFYRFHHQTDRTKMHAKRIEHQINLYQQIYGRNDLIVVVDSLQKLPFYERGMDKRISMDEWLRFFERMKNQYGITLILLSEANRQSYGGPTLQAGKESGDIEYTADCLIQLSLPEMAKHFQSNGNKWDPPIPPYGNIAIKEDCTSDVFNRINMYVTACRYAPSGKVGTYRPSEPFCCRVEPNGNINW